MKKGSLHHTDYLTDMNWKLPRGAYQTRETVKLTQQNGSSLIRLQSDFYLYFDDGEGFLLKKGIKSICIPVAPFASSEALTAFSH